jgi:O-antigen/teichoic acid export membrane protein
MSESILDPIVHRGLRWAALRQAVAAVSGTAGVLAYTRFLGPEELGAATMALIVYYGLVMLVEVPIRDALIYHRERETEHATSAFWLLLSFSTGAALLVLLLAGPLARAYRAPEVAGLVRATAFAFFFHGLAVVPAALLLKQFRFAAYEGLGLVADLVVLGGWILLAALGCGAWSLILPPVAAGALWAAMVWWAARFRPVGRPQGDAVRAIVRFARSLVGSNLIAYARDYMDQAAVGTLGQAPLGWYTLGEKQSAFAVTTLGLAVGRVGLPALAAARMRAAELGQIYLDLLRLTATLATPLQVGALVLADLGLRFLFGEQWLPAVTVLRAYLAFRLVHCLLPMADAVVSAVGRPEIRFRVDLVQLPLYLAGLWFGLRVLGGIDGVAWSLAAIRLVAGLVYLAVTLRLAALSAALALRALLPSSLAAAGMGLAVHGLYVSGAVLRFLPVGQLPAVVDALHLLALVLAGATCYLVLLFLLNPRAFRQVLVTSWRIAIPGRTAEPALAGEETKWQT